jgi:hypothetical protein
MDYKLEVVVVPVVRSMPATCGSAAGQGAST